MVKANNILTIDIDHNEMHKYDDDAPISAKSPQSRNPNTESAQIVRPKQSRWRKMADIVAPQLPKSKAAKRDTRSGGPRRLTNTDSLILLFQARKRRLDGLESNSESLSNASEPIMSINGSHIESLNSDRDDIGLLHVITPPTPSELASSTEDCQRNDSDDLCEKVTVTPDGVTVCDTSMQTMPQVATPYGYLFNGVLPAKGRNRAASLNLDHAILKRGYNCHDLILRNSGHTPRVDNQGVVTWVDEKTPTVSKIKLGSTRVSSGESKKGEDNKHHSVHTRSSYETLLRYLTIVRDYPEDFEKLRHMSVNESTRLTSVRSLVNVGSAFSSIQRAIGKRETPVQFAAYELGCRLRLRSPPTAASVSPREDRPSSKLKLRSMSRENSTQFRIHSSIVENDSNECVYLSNTKQILAQHGVVVSELWRAREDAKKAMASISTNRSQIETGMALEALEEEKGSIQQWWVAQKDCRYLRRRGSADVCCVQKTETML